MNELTILKQPRPECCATCSEWALAQYCHTPDFIKGNEPYCPVLRISLQYYFKEHGSKQVTCDQWKRDWVDSDANEVYYELMGVTAW